MSKIKVNEELCIGCGTCESVCPSVFKIENGKSKVISQECKDCNSDEIDGICPVGAISSKE
jgi:ferredoxin